MHTCAQEISLRLPAEPTVEFSAVVRTLQGPSGSAKYQLLATEFKSFGKISRFYDNRVKLRKKRKECLLSKARKRMQATGKDEIFLK